ncbi:MAG: 16S rRNA (cytosine(1402)-N(4))-methyltransferase RsmH, partial [Patescibacteria group bacterium]
TVLLNEAIEGLNLKNGAIVADATFGGGGHSLEICKRFPEARIIALDQDRSSWERTKDKFENCKISFHNENFRDLDKVLIGLHLKGFDGIIFDLGLSSDQLENSGRGFSFLLDEPLLMQMKNLGTENSSEEEVTAYDVVNSWSEKNLADIIYGYGEEKFARRIARGIAEAREKAKIKTTFDLVKIIESAVPAVYRRERIHFATRTFQAIRIAVNDELGALTEGLKKGFKFLKNGGRMSVITFHSLEDRIAKRFYKEKEKEGEARLINKKVILANDSEVKSNPRSRSAKLRILEKTK